MLLGTAAAGFRKPQLAARVYAGLLVVATLWALAETGLNIWGLEVRLLTLVGLGAWLLLPGIWRTGASWLDDKKPLLAGLTVACVALVASCFSSYSIDGVVPADRMAAAMPDLKDGVPVGDWHYYGRNAQGQRYSPLTQITPGNISHLKRAWVSETGDTQQAGEAVVAGPDAGHEFNLELTPIKVGDTLYMCTPHSWVMAMDAATGKIKWKYDPHPAKADLDSNVYLACRGVSYYRIPDEIQTSCRERIYSPWRMRVLSRLMPRPASPARILAITALFPCVTTWVTCRWASISSPLLRWS